MKVSLSEYNRFLSAWFVKSLPGGAWEPLRFGQAWFNHFKMHAHHMNLPMESEARRALDRVYNDTNNEATHIHIMQHYVDIEN